MMGLGTKASVLVLALVLGACAVPNHYLGIPTKGPMTAEEQRKLRLAEASVLGTGDCLWVDRLTMARTSLPCEVLRTCILASSAWSDDKPAILELGKRLEEGRGIAQDLDKAEKLYRLAASDTTNGTVVATNQGNEPVFWTSATGLPEARERLIALQARRATK